VVFETRCFELVVFFTNWCNQHVRRKFSLKSNDDKGLQSSLGISLWLKCKTLTHSFVWSLPSHKILGVQAVFNLKCDHSNSYSFVGHKGFHGTRCSNSHLLMLGMN
jgi:hypothetical protein